MDKLLEFCKNKITHMKIEIDNRYLLEIHLKEFGYNLIKFINFRE